MKRPSFQHWSDIDDAIDARLNRRAQYAVLALAALLAFSLIARLGDAAAAARMGAETARDTLARQGGDVDLDLWRARAQEAEAAVDAWRDTQWRGPTGGVVAAQLQRAIVAASDARVSVSGLSVEPEPAPLSSGPALRFGARARAGQRADMAAFLATLGAHQPRLVVNEATLIFSNAGDAQLVANGVAPVLIEAPEPDPANGGEPGQ